jgi:hypothetical protein
VRTRPRQSWRVVCFEVEVATGTVPWSCDDVSADAVCVVAASIATATISAFRRI